MDLSKLNKYFIQNLPIPDFPGYSNVNEAYEHIKNYKTPDDVRHFKTPEQALNEIYDKYNIEEMSMLEKHQKEEALPSTQLYNIPFNIIPGAPGQYIPPYEKIDYPDAPLHLYPTTKKRITIKKPILSKIPKKKRYNKYILRNKRLLR